MGNNEKRLRSLTWKHFWRRKRQEVGEFFKKAILPIFLVQIFLFIIIGFSLSVSLEGELAVNLSLGFTLTMIVVVELVIIFFYKISKVLIKWLRSNWKLATQDAVKELKQRRSRPRPSTFQDKRRKNKR